VLLEWLTASYTEGDMMRVFIRRLTKSDPTTFVTSFAVWSIVVGTALAGPHNLFTIWPSWQALEEIYNNDNAWGWLMISDGIMLLVSIRWAIPTVRATITLFSAVLWFVIGGAMLASGYQHGYISTIGLYSVICAVMATLATEQWLYAGV